MQKPRTATAARTLFLLSPPPGRIERDARADYDETWGRINERDQDADRNVARAAMEWIASVDASGNDYLMNLKALVLKAEWTAKDAGLGASLIRAYQREMGKIAERQAREAADAERKATAEPVPHNERIEVTGIVASTDTRQNDYGVRHIWTVETDRGFKLWGTIPKALVGDAKVGDTVRFTAKLERSDRDETFGFYSRPSKASVVES